MLFPAPARGLIRLKSSKCGYRNISQKSMICEGHFPGEEAGASRDGGNARLWEDDAAAGGGMRA